MRLLTTAATLLVLLASPVAAMMAPEVYEKARAEAPNAVVIAITSVTEPDGSYGQCQVRGTVAAVERGTLFTAGQAIELDVPCYTRPDADFPDGGTIWQDGRALAASAFGRAFLDGLGELVLSQYDQLDASS